MADPAPWPDWLEDLTGPVKVREILCAVAAQYEPISDGDRKLLVTDAEPLILRLLEEARAASPSVLAEARLAAAMAVLREMAPGGRLTDPDRGGDADEIAAMRGRAAGALETIARLGEHPEPPPLVPEGTYVHAAIKGFIERDGYLFTGQWLGDPHMVVLRDKDGAFAEVFPRSSVHLISAQPEPGSEPEQPDPWAGPTEVEAARSEVAASRRLLAAAHLKIAALSEWAAGFLEGDQALAEVRAIIERDFTAEAGDAEPPF
jgi:hypothetical protein